jgi:hypothetical protein
MQFQPIFRAWIAARAQAAAVRFRRASLACIGHQKARLTRLFRLRNPARQAVEISQAAQRVESGLLQNLIQNPQTLNQKVS